MLDFSSHQTTGIPYVGRFAPSPTGPLHFGSLLTALASYLEAHQQQGKWLVRIEDLDPPREMPHASSLILQALETYGLHWHGDIVYQSRRSKLYQQALDQLISQQQAFACACSRKSLSQNQGLHLNSCPTPQTDEFAWRFDCPSGTLLWQDVLQGRQTIPLDEQIGDFIIKRRDHLWAYQLAVVVDDQLQGISHVVRGIDLIDSTSRQLLLQQALGYKIPEYSHLPVACAPNGQKLSKQNLAQALDLNKPEQTLWLALKWLDLEPEQSLQKATISEQIDWAKQHWDMAKLHNVQQKLSPI